MFLKCSASRIGSFCLLFWCSNIVFSIRIFRKSVVGHVCILKCCAMELVSERCIVSLLDRVVEVKPTYILLFSEIWYYSFTTPSLPLVSWLPHVSTGLSLFLSTPTLLSDPRKEKMIEVQSMKVGIRVGEMKKLPSKF